MTKEELLIPRYKVSEEGYPDMIFNPGQILVLNKTDSQTGQPYWLSPKKNHWYAPFFDRFPSIFKKLEWYQDRKPEEMPMYLERYGKIYDVDSWEIDTEGELFFWLKKRMNGAFDWYPENQNVSPATEEEYNAYIQKQTTNG